MQVYDISQELFGCHVDPGDPVPQKIVNKRMTDGEPYNQTSMHLCAHNGTHIDAPFHLFPNGKTVGEIPLEKTVGWCTLVRHSGVITAEDAAAFLQIAAQTNPDATRRLLVQGDVIVSPEAAAVWADAGLLLLGIERQSVDYGGNFPAVHNTLLAAETVLLEGLRMAHVPAGVYLLSATPLHLAGSDGSPCRAVLIDLPFCK